jgi:hypothetical protein
MPTQVQLAIRLLWAQLGLGLINAVIQWNYLTSQATPQFVIAVQATTVAVIAWLIYKMWKGRNWARITFAILFLLGLIPALLILAATFNRSLVVGCLSVAGLICQLVALYLIFVSPGRSWFAGTSKPS